MKWNNKGKELDLLGDYISSLKEIYIFGAGVNGEFIYNLLKQDLIINAFVDNDVSKQGTKYLDLPVIGKDELNSKKGEKVIIVAVSQRNTFVILDQLINDGFQLNKNLFDFKLFIPLFEMYRNNKLFLSGCTLSITERCSLNCEKCSILTPYLEKPRHQDKDELKADIDLFFNTIDYIQAFNLLGGEPFLYPYLSEIIDYIGTHYSNKVGRVTLITNGMIIPKEELILTMKKNNVLVTISDYRQALPSIEERVLMFLECMKNNEIEFYLEKAEKWIDFGYDNINQMTRTESELCTIFDQCNTPCRLVQNGKYYFCANSKFAINAGLLDCDKENEFDLRTVNDENKKHLLEFEWGYNHNGYIELCKKCNGYLTINKNYIEVAKQKR